jgi:hypothetical protein
MAEVMGHSSFVTVKVQVPYHGTRFLDQRRLEFITEKIQQFVDEKLTSDLRCLRFSDET